MSDAIPPEEKSWSNPIKAWLDSARWAELMTIEGCPFCQAQLRDVLVELPGSWVLGGPRAALPGYVLVLSKHHAIEPYQLSPPERAQFWDEAMRTAEAIARVVQPVKMNYEIHGNTIPHLHMHLFPRFRGDPFERGPIDPHGAEPFTRTGEELDRLRAAIAAAFPDSATKASA